MGKLMVPVYSQLKFLNPPNSHFYKMLEDVSDLTGKPDAELLVAVSLEGCL